jgi:hypothetical protein
LAEQVYSISQHSSAGIKAIQPALSCLRICTDEMAQPLHAFDDSEREELRIALQIINVSPTTGTA